MGKKGRKTRWRTLTITDEHSDSEESNTTTSGHRVSKGYPQKSFYSRFTYSSQSTPTRRYQCDGTKSTRSSSTASENKITFNEDEYTRITTPRQDVLFKKGYLNKPKTYQTQTSTGNSTTSTGNSTGNGTPDHQSTDLEYESQFVFPNGFVDQNGIYYVNSFEPYPLMVFNPPTYYPDFTSVKSKRCSTGSLTESTSPNNEETSQDLSQSETPNNVSDFNNHVYNVIYPGFYFNGACQPQDVANHHQPEPRRMKKKRRRKLSRSKSLQEATTSEYTDESSDEVFGNDRHREKAEELAEEAQHDRNEEEEEEEEEDKDKKEREKEKVKEEVEVEEKKEAATDAQKLLMNGLSKDHQEDSIEEEEEEEEEEEKTTKEEPASDNEEEEEEEEKQPKTKPKYDLKPDAEEFVPRAYRHAESIPPLEPPPPPPPNVQFIKIPSNFVPLPILNPLGDFNGGQNFNAFIPPGIPINFIPHHQNYVNYIPSYVNGGGDKQQHNQQQQQQATINEKVEEEAKETTTSTTTTTTTTTMTTVEVPKSQIDIAKIVSKLEEAAKEQDEVGTTSSSPVEEVVKSTRKTTNGSGRIPKRNRYQQKPEEPAEPKKSVWKQVDSPKKEVTATVAPPVRNYSDTLKRGGGQPTAQTRCERHEKHMDRLRLDNRTTVKEAVVKNHVKVEPPKTSNQWISVSSRKKRKNRNVEETEDFKDKEEEEASVVENGVEEVVPPPLPLPEPIIAEEAAPSPPPPVEESTVESVKVEKMEPPPPPPVALPQTKEEAKEEKVKAPSCSKKKSKKSGQKAAVKRVIIKDVDLTHESKGEVHEEDNKPVVVDEEKRHDDEQVAASAVEVTVAVEEEKPVEAKVEATPEKKSRKKKKKPTKTTTTTVASSLSSSSTTLNVVDDSYDFLLESSPLLDESSREKTNVEVSQELDKMIQRGMYSSLEEKIKRLNIEPSDNFFKTVIRNISRESSVEKNHTYKNPDFGRLLASSTASTTTSQLLKSKPPSSTELKKLGDFLGEGTPRPAPVVGGDGLVVAEEEEEKEQQQQRREEDSEAKLYPITKAVKEWMTKTRETTPDVEIFKSPSAIFREFNGNHRRKNGEVVNGFVADEEEEEEEVTVYSSSGGEGSSDDLMEYWEDPAVPPAETKTKTSSSSVEEGEDVLEEYESKYGRNEDYLRIKREAEESRGSFPKHGNLPYRAICCSIM